MSAALPLPFSDFRRSAVARYPLAALGAEGKPAMAPDEIARKERAHQPPGANCDPSWFELRCV